MARRDLTGAAGHVLQHAEGDGAGDLAAICAQAETVEQALAAPALERVRDALDAALADVAAYRHELMLRGLKA